MENKKRNYTPLVAILVSLGVIGVIGSTFAYFTSEVTLQNIFGTKTYKTEVTENFESPEDWTPGVTTSKEVFAKNIGNVDVAVRISLEESWVDALGNKIPLETDSGVRASIINFADDVNTKWTKETKEGIDYYYYNKVLLKGESTSSLIKSVTFNPRITEDSNSCISDTSNRSRICSNANGYIGGTYTLSVKVETVQYNGYKDAWSTGIEINR